jgi:AcrR family transcriptional regulator
VAARALFDKHGLPGLSMRRIADAVGVTPMAIYKHYADKDALMDALMLDGFAAWESRVGAIKATAPLNWLEAMTTAFLDFALQSPRRYEAAFLLPARKARRYPDDFDAGRSPVISRALAQIAEAQRRGEIIAAPPLDVVLALTGMAQGLVSMHHAGRFVSEAQFRKSYRTALGHGLRAFLARKGDVSA